MTKGNGIKGTLPNLLVNDSVYDSISTDINHNYGSMIPQPLLIIGQEGSGKTTLLKRLYTSVIGKGRIASWIDGRTVFTSEDIIKKALETQADVVFIDDMDFYLTRCSYQEQYRLRRYLYNENAPMLVGSVKKVWPAMTEYEAPFFEGLKNMYLPAVSIEAAVGDLDLTAAARMRALYPFLPPTIKSWETIRHIISINDNPEEDIKFLMIRFADKFRSIYESLPANSQHILNAFGNDAKDLTIPEFKKITGLQTSVLTSYLKNLVSQGVVIADKTVKRHTRYSMKDPLFQKWLWHSDT